VELGWIMERRVVWAEVVGARAEVVGARAEVVGTRAAVWGAASTFDIAIADPKTIDFREKVTTRLDERDERQFQVTYWRIC